MGKIIDISGKRVGSLLILNEHKKMNGYIHWKCLCDCGNIKYINGASLRRKNGTQSCGCYNRTKLLGHAFGEWMVLKSAGVDKNGHAIYTCVCSCGAVSDLTADNLERGMSRSCGCKKVEFMCDTFESKYGVRHVLATKEFVDKSKKTLMRNYGVEHITQNKDIRAKIEATNIRKYGVPNPAQNPEIMKKILKSSSSTYTTKHWFSNEDIMCQGSYEKKTVEYFNANKIDYNWQVQIFLMPNGRTYRPDCYLPDEDKWVEIKGYFRKDAEEKWNWFHKEYPNSELWNEKILKQKGIL